MTGQGQRGGGDPAFDCRMHVQNRVLQEAPDSMSGSIPFDLTGYRPNRHGERFPGNDALQYPDSLNTVKVGTHSGIVR